MSETTELISREAAIKAADQIEADAFAKTGLVQGNVAFENGRIKAAQAIALEIAALPAVRVDEKAALEDQLFKVTKLYHAIRRHNQYFERCESQWCIDARELLGIKGFEHRWDDAYHQAVEEVADGRQP